MTRRRRTIWKWSPVASEPRSGRCAGSVTPSSFGQRLRVRCIHVQNGSTEVECRVYQIGDERTDKWPYEVKTPRGNWKASDSFGAMAVVHGYEKLPKGKKVVLT